MVTPEDRARRGPLVLLALGDEDDALVAGRALAGDRAVNVAVVRDGPEAFDFLLRRGAHAGRAADDPPHLVLMDIDLPDSGGVEVLERLRADERTRLLPVVMLAPPLRPGADRECDLARLYAAGVNSCLRKPAEPVALERVVRQASAYWLGLNLPPNVGGASL